MRKKVRPAIAAAALLLFLSAIACKLLLFPAPPTAEQATQLVRDAVSSDSYSFELNATLTTGAGGERQLLAVSGCVQGENSQLSGQTLGAPLSLVLLDGTLYQQSGDSPWLSTPMAEATDALALLAELFPAEAFRFSTVSGYEYLGRASGEHGRCSQARLSVAAEGWVGEYFRDAQYLLCCDRRCRELHSLQLSAAIRDDPQGWLELSVTFDDAPEQAISAPL